MMKFKHGDRVTCTIGGIKINDAKISIVGNGRPYICQDYKAGSGATQKLGYKYSWILDDDFTNDSVSGLRPLKKTLEDLEEGDVVIGPSGQKRTVLGVCGKVVFLSSPSDKELYSGTYSEKTLKSYGYKVDQPEQEEVEEITMEELCKELGREVKIKK